MVIDGKGLTVIVKDSGIPLHRFAKGVTSISDEIGNVPVLTPVKGAISPCPDDGDRPIVIVEFVQLNTVPAGLPVNEISWVCSSWQITKLLKGSTIGSGVTKIVTESEF